MGSIPTNKEMDAFRAELARLTEDEIEAGLVQQRWGSGENSWKWSEANVFLARKRRADEDRGHIIGAKRDARQTAALEKQVDGITEANRIATAANVLAGKANETSKEANRVAFAAFVMAAIALALSLYLF